MNILAGVLIFLVLIILFRKRGISKNQYRELIEMDALLIDVRSSQEYKSGSKDGAINIPHIDIVKGVKKRKIGKDRPIILFCASGGRSFHAISLLKSQGYSNLYNGGSLFHLRNF